MGSFGSVCNDEEGQPDGTVILKELFFVGLQSAVIRGACVRSLLVRLAARSPSLCTS